MRNLFFPTLLFALAPATPLAAQDETPAPPVHSVQEAQGSDRAAPPATDRAGDGRMMSPFETARRLAKAWPLAIYMIRRGDRDVGIYIQRNTMGTVGDDKTIEYFDTIKYPKKNQNTLIQTMCGTDSRFDVRGMAGKIDMGQMKMQVVDGHLRGTQFGQTPVDMEVPDFFQTDLTILRKPYGVLFREKERTTFPYIKMEKVPGEETLLEGVLHCVGFESIELEDQSFDAWKFRWVVDGSRPVFIWYGSDGNLLKRVYRNEIWEFSPSRTSKAIRNGKTDSATTKKKNG